MLLGVPYDQAAIMPLDVALALLNDERLDNTHQTKQNKSNAPSDKSNVHLNKADGTTFVAKGRKNSKSKD
ncbi:TPA: hypothetical protein MW296_000157 [Acinetobacter baumannii]|nr:hypothetical protein [Acinetobacter baumannii]